MFKFDYIILGAGASGLMLAYRMAKDPFFDHKKILIIDKDKTKGNDRTWCFWEKGAGEWDDIVHKQWREIYFGSEWYSSVISLNNYTYKMVRSGLFYTTLWNFIQSKSNITFQHAHVTHVNIDQEIVEITTDTGIYKASKAFNSLSLKNLFKTQKKYPVLQQHFVGWFIETKAPIFDDSCATFMDFSVPQIGNTRFMYILPINKNKALFEYTLFSKELLPIKEYETSIKAYLRKKNILEYTILEKESGAIPMTCYDFSKTNSKHILNIGTAGGWTKPSTGYTFQNTTKKTKLLVEFLKHEDDFTKFGSQTKFWFYDLLMLDVLAHENGKGSLLFSQLFKKVKVQTIFKFLDEESNLMEDLKIIISVPSFQFLKVLVKRIFSVS